ncbi:MAG: YdbH domain-containing protein [Pseudomonadota bacterium]
MIDLAEVGTPFTDLRVDFSMPSTKQVDVSRLTFNVLGGALATRPFSYDLTAGATDVDVRLTGIQLPFMAEMTGLESVQVEGSLSGSVPLRIERNAVTGGNGRLTNDPPGGVIRLDAESASTLAGSAGVEYVTRALDNFVFEALTSDVEYRPDGDLVLNMRLEGTNPSLDPDQPIVLNLGIENNVPQLLRSLQALRSIEAMLENRLDTRE